MRNYGVKVVSSGKWGFQHLPYEDKEGVGAREKLVGKLEQEVFSSRRFTSICQEIIITCGDYVWKMALGCGSFISLRIAVRYFVQCLVDTGSQLSPGMAAFVPSPSQRGTWSHRQDRVWTSSLPTSPPTPLPSWFKSTFRKYSYLSTEHLTRDFARNKNVDTPWVSVGTGPLSLSWNAAL